MVKFFRKHRKAVTPVIAVMMLVAVAVAAVGAYVIWFRSFQIQTQKNIQDTHEEPIHKEYWIRIYDKEDKFALQFEKLDDMDLVGMPVFAYDIKGYEFYPIDSKDLNVGMNDFYMERSDMWKYYYKVIQPYEFVHPRFLYLGHNNCYDGALNIFVEGCFPLNYKGYKYDNVFSYEDGSIIIRLPSAN